MVSLIKKLVSIAIIFAAVSMCQVSGILAQTVSPGEIQESTEETETETETEQPEEEPAIRVLLVGNSFTKSTVDGVVLSVEQPLEEMADAAGHKLEVETVAHGGAKQAGVVTITVQNTLDATDVASYQLYVSLPRTTGVKVREVSVQKPTAKSGKLKLSWKQVEGATKYNIYRSTSKTGTYTLVGTSNSNTFVDTSVPFQKVCYYKVAAGNSYDLCMGELSAPVRGIVLKSPTVTAKRTNRTTVKLSWKRNTLANGYIIYRSTKSMTGYRKIATIASNKTITYMDRVTAGKTYYYRIKAYRKIDGITYRSIRSKNVVVKK